jgi:hypothetical protein
VLGALLQLGPGVIFLATAQVAVALPGLAALFVSGSVLDGDLTRSTEGAMQALLVEEVPATQVRLMLAGLGALLAAAQVWLLVTLDGWVALIALATLSAAVVGVSGAYGRLALPRVVR